MVKNIRMYYFLISVVGGVFATAMPLYYQGLSFSEYQIGILIALPSVAMLLQPIWGIFVDKYNKPRELGILGIILSGFVLSLLIFVNSFHQVLFVVALFTLIKAPVWSSIDNIIITYCMNEGVNYGPLRVFASIAWGASLIFFLPFSLIFGFKSFFVINLIISVYVAYIILKLPNTIKLNDSGNNLSVNSKFSEGLKSLYKNKSFRFIILYTLFFSTLFVTNLNYQAMYFEQLGQSNLFISIAMIVSIAPELVLLPIAERMSSNINPIKLLMIVSFSYIIKYLGFAVITDVYLLLLFAALHGIAMSFYIPVFIKLVKRTVPNNVSTTAITLNGFTSAITGIITSLVAGQISGSWGIEYVFYLIAFFQFCSLLVLLLFKQKTNIQNLS